MDIAYFLSFYSYIKQGELNLQKRCNRLEGKKQILEILAVQLDILELSVNIIETMYIISNHKLPNRVRSVYFVDSKGHFEQMINGRISFLLSCSIT